MKIRHIENGDIDFCASLFRIKREALHDRLLHSKGRFNDTLYYIAYDEATGINEGAFAFHNIDYKNRHLAILAAPKTKELLDLAAKYAFAQFDFDKVYFFSREAVKGYSDEGTVRDEKGAVTVCSLTRTPQNS